MTFLKWLMRLSISCGIACLIFLCSCATQKTVRPTLPAETTGADSGRIYLTLHLKDGTNLLFAVDTGGPGTVLDKSLEPLLGKCSGESPVNYGLEGIETNLNVYKAPELYLGDTRLLIGHEVATDDLKSRCGDDPPVMGILGLDCLLNYCIQLDFASHKIRFLDPDQAEKTISGEKFPLKCDFSSLNLYVQAKFLGKSNARWNIDTGADVDVMLVPKQWQELQKQTSGQPVELTEEIATNGLLVGTVYYLPPKIFTSKRPDETNYFTSKIIFNNESCANFVLEKSPDSLGENLIGCRFLSRYLTTLNFPKQTLHLEHNSAGSPTDNDITSRLKDAFEENAQSAFESEASDYFMSLGTKNELPGLPKDQLKGTDIKSADEGTNFNYPFSLTLVITKKSNASQYHYTFVQFSRDSVVKLQKAWRTDSSGRVVEEYPVP